MGFSEGFLFGMKHDLGFFVSSFQGLPAHFFQALNHVPFVWRYHILFIHLLMGILVASKFLAIINKAAATSTQALVWTEVFTFSGKYQGAQMLDHMAQVRLLLKESIFSSGHHFCIPTANNEEFLFSYVP